MKNNPLKTFIIYSHEDREYKNVFEKFLRHLIRRQKIVLWSDKEIKPGEYWDETIHLNLSEADIIVMLISVDFYNSEYIQDKEFTKAKNKLDAGEVLLIPILVRYCPWKSYDLIKDLQLLPTGAKSVDTWVSKDHAFTDVAEKIEELVDALLEKRSRSLAAQIALQEEKGRLEKQKEDDEKNENLRNRRDEMTWKKLCNKVEEASSTVEKIVIYQTYLEEAENKNHRTEAEDFINDLNVEIVLQQKLEVKKLKKDVKKKCCCVLVLDTSGSMEGNCIHALNLGLQSFYRDIKRDTKTASRLEIGIIAFDSDIHKIQDPPALVQNFTLPNLTTGSTTKIVDGVREGIRMVQDRINWYDHEGIPYYRPWVILMTDGSPDTGQDVNGLSKEIKLMVAQNKLAFFAIGLDEGVDKEMLLNISAHSWRPAIIKHENISLFFKWLSECMAEYTNQENLNEPFIFHEFPDINLL